MFPPSVGVLQHINVEWCNQAGSIKYLFKYINKGPDRVTIAVENNASNMSVIENVDEIKEFYDCRYLSACEASWRIFAFDVHHNVPPVMRLPFHLTGQQSVIYGADSDPKDVMNKPSVLSSMFLSWFECKRKFPHARELSYVEFPTKFVFDEDERSWYPRKNRSFSLGQIHSVSPSAGEAYFLRILLNKVRGPTCFEDIRTVNNHLHHTFRDACYALGLLDDDTEYIEAINEASESGSGYYIRNLFATMLMCKSLSRPYHVWEHTWEKLPDGILHKQRAILKAKDLTLNDDQIKNLTLFEIEKILTRNSDSLRNYDTMPFPDFESVASSCNLLINEQLAYDRDEIHSEFEELYSYLNQQQSAIYDEIMLAVDKKQGGVFFVYGYDETGKTYLWKTLSSSLRSSGQIVLNVASSGIASLLLSGGRTTHSRFHIPLNLDESSLSHIDLDSNVAHLLRCTSLIIWDEAPMIHRHGFEALDKTLCDVLHPPDDPRSKIPFGGKVVAFGGDFRQILPVVPNGTRQDVVNASISSSYLWNECKFLRLTENMRLTRGGDVLPIKNTRMFAKWLLDIREGNIGGQNNGEAVINIPDELPIKDESDPLGSLIEFVYPSLLQNLSTPDYFKDKAILAATNEVVTELNDQILPLFPGDT